MLQAERECRTWGIVHLLRLGVPPQQPPRRRRARGHARGVAAAVHGGAGRGVLNGAVPGVPSGRFGAPVCAPALANRRGMLHPADTLLAERAAGAHGPAGHSTNGASNALSQVHGSR